MAITDSGAVTDEQVLVLCDQLLAECDPRSTPPREFLGRQFDLGLGWVHFPLGQRWSRRRRRSSSGSSTSG